MAAPQLTAYVQGQGSVSGDQLNSFGQTCDTAAQLRTFVGLPGINVWLTGINTANDGQAGWFRWTTGTGFVDNNITVIVPSAASSGAWVRTITNYVGVYTVATLPAAATAGVGAEAFVTDAISATFNATAVGSGSNKVPVFSDGAHWLIG